MIPLESRQAVEFAAGHFGAKPMINAIAADDLGEAEADGRVPDADADFLEVKCHVVGIEKRDHRFVNDVWHGVIVIALGIPEVVQEIRPVPLRVVRDDREYELHLGDDGQQAFLLG